MTEKVPYAYARNITFFRELTEGETWCVHPSGRGIIVAHPERLPLWCYAHEDGTVRQEVIVCADPEPSPLEKAFQEDTPQRRIVDTALKKLGEV